MIIIIVLQVLKMNICRKGTIIFLLCLCLFASAAIDPVIQGPLLKVIPKINENLTPVTYIIKNQTKAPANETPVTTVTSPIQQEPLSKIIDKKATTVAEQTQITLPDLSIKDPTLKGGVLLPPIPKIPLPPIPPLPVPPYPIPSFPKIPITPIPPPPQSSPPTRDPTKELAGVIISFHNGYTYDGLFSEVKQESKEGSVVLTYLTTISEEKTILEGLTGNYSDIDKNMRAFLGQIDKLTEKCPSCIVFNWECSSGFSGQTFDNKGQYTFGLVELAIKKGYLTMFSDFSLKALIKQWNSKILGPNPFVKLGSTSTAIQLKFNRDQLLRSPSTQLQAVAHLAASEQLFVHVLGNTIKYAVDSRVETREIYEIEVLTVASNFPPPQPYYQSKIGNATGLAGHVLLSYKTGGKILTSMGHWIQLMKITTTEQKLFETAQKLYGDSELNRMKIQYDKLAPEEKLQYQAEKSKIFVQNQSPGTNAIQMNVAGVKGGA